MTTVYDLPDEVMEYVFSYLSCLDRSNVKLVNKRWLEVANSKRLTKEDYLVFGPSIRLQNCIIRRRSLNIRIENLSLCPPRSLKFWEDYGLRIKSLDLFGANQEDPMLYEILKYCPKLEHLVLFPTQSQQSRCTSKLLRSSTNSSLKLDNLLSLHITCRGVLEGQSIAKLTASSARLECLVISLTRESTCDPSAGETILSLIGRQSHTLRELALTNCQFANSVFLNELYKYSHLHLTALSISNGRILKHEDVTEIIKHFTLLEKADLGRHMDWPPHDDLTMINSLKDLKVVTSTFVIVNSVGLSAILSLENLEGLELNCGLMITNSFINAFGNIQLPKLKDLRVNLPVAVSVGLTQILPLLPNLKFLHISCNFRFGIQDLSMIFDNCKFLKYLSLPDTSYLGPLTPSVSDNNPKYLKHLNLERCEGLAVEHVSCLLKHVKLETIDLWDVEVPLKGLESLVKNCRSLRRIYLNDKLAKAYDYNKIASLVNKDNSIFSFSSHCVNMNFRKNILGHLYR